MDESENLEYLNKLAITIGVSFGNVYLVRMRQRHMNAYFAKFVILMIVLIKMAMVGLSQGVYANLDIMQVISVVKF